MARSETGHSAPALGAQPDTGHSPAVADIVRRSGKSQGYALVIGEPDSRLAETLAAATQLHILNVLPEDAQLDVERERLIARGIYGSHVALQTLDVFESPLSPGGRGVGREGAGAGKSLPDGLPCASYFADMVVVSAKVKDVSPEDCYRCLRPCGGALCLVGFSEEERQRFLQTAKIPTGELSKDGELIVRGDLPGAGQWHYPWADGGRTGVSQESLVRFPLQVLWFGGPGPDRLMDRHWMGSPPLFASGRVFMIGQHHVIAFDAYNGRELWSRRIENVGRRYSQYYSCNAVADDDSLYVVQGDRCHRLDQAGGNETAVYRIPESVIRRIDTPPVPEYVDIQWPTTWQVLGPLPKGKPPLAAEDLRTLPGRATVQGNEYTAAAVHSEDGLLDFAALYKDPAGPLPARPGSTASPGKRARPKGAPGRDVAASGRIAYAFAKIRCPKAGKLLVGAGADWWMQWYLDGKPVFDTLDGGNEPSRNNDFSPKPCSTSDHLFDIDVTAGEHVLAVMVKSGSTGWRLASAGMGRHAREALPVVTGDENVPNLKDMVWGYLSAVGDLVLGTLTVPIAEGQPAESQLIWRSESKALFALDKKDGSLRWVYRARPGRTISNTEIAFGDGRLFLLDATSKADSVRAARRGEKPAIRLTLVALDLANGRELWLQDDVPALADRSMPSRLKSNPTHLFMGLPNWGHLVYAKDTVVLGANAAYDAATGKKLWEKAVRPQKLPIVQGNWLIAQPFAYDLRTGQERMTTDPLTGDEVPWRYARAFGCGPVNGCQNLLFFRSGADGFFDMAAEGTTNFGGVRPGCSRSILAAGGLVIHPEGFSGCCCSYNYQTSLALVSAPQESDAWYVFPQHAAAGPIRQLAVNFGAPGDRRDRSGRAWLGFPRPMLDGACPAPVTVVMDNASCYFRRSATASIQGADAPWVYASGLRGAGRIAIDLELQPNLALPVQQSAPIVDGDLDDPCWQQVPSVAFENKPFTMLGASVDFRIFKDAENLYFGYQRKPLANARTDVDEAMLGRSDALEIYVTDRAKQGGLHLGLRRDGQSFATFGTVDRYRKVDPTWSGQWRHASRSMPGQWTAEVAIPLALLTQSGLDIRRLELNCMSLDLTQSGLESVFLTDPRYGADFKRCIGFRALVDPPRRQLPARRFTIRLHFAEIDDAAPGDRVFDVAIQGKTVLRNLDIVREAGGKNRALVKELRGIKADQRIVIDLIPQDKNAAPEQQPVICGVEVMEDS